MDAIEIESKLRYAGALLVDVDVALRDIPSPEIAEIADFIKSIGQRFTATSNEMMAKRLADLVAVKNFNAELNMLPEYEGDRRPASRPRRHR